MNTPDLHLKTCFVFNDADRIVSTRELQSVRGPLFILVRGLDSCAWAVRADVADDVAVEVDRIARDEPPATDFRHAPVDVDRYISLLRDRIEDVSRSENSSGVSRSCVRPDPALQHFLDESRFACRCSKVKLTAVREFVESFGLRETSQQQCGNPSGK